MKKIFTILFLAGISLQSFGQAVSKSFSATNPPELSLIKEADLKKDIFELAGDAFRGRRAGTLDEMRAAVWVAQKAMEAGLKPAGDDGTYFQFYNLKRTITANNGTFFINNKNLLLWREVWPTQPVETHLNGPVTWLNSMADTTKDLKGKIVAVKIVPPSPLPVSWMSLWGLRYISLAVRQQSMKLRTKGVSAIILVADQQTEASLGFVGHNYQEGLYQLEGTRVSNVQQIPVIVVQGSSAGDLQQANAIIKADFRPETYLYPSVNVVAKAAGTDAQLKNEYV